MPKQIVKKKPTGKRKPPADIDQRSPSGKPLKN